MEEAAALRIGRTLSTGPRSKERFTEDQISCAMESVQGSQEIMEMRRKTTRLMCGPVHKCDGGGFVRIYVKEHVIERGMYRETNRQKSRARCNSRLDRCNSRVPAVLDRHLP